MKALDLLLKASPLIFSSICLIFIIVLIIRILTHENKTISVDYGKSIILKLTILILIIYINYIFLGLKWLEELVDKKLTEGDKLWNLNLALNAIFNILAISKLYIAMTKSQCILKKEKEKEKNNLVIEILTKIDDTKLKHIFYFIAIMVVLIIFFILALLGKQEAFSVLQPATNLIK